MSLRVTRSAPKPAGPIAIAECRVPFEGSLMSKLVVVAPPNKTEPSQIWPAFHRAVVRSWFQRCRMPELESYLLVPSALGKGADASRCASEVKVFLVQGALSGRFNGMICMGSAAFKAIFGYGRKPSMTSLAGSTVTMVEFNRLPLFTFPDMPETAPDLDNYRIKREVQAIERRMQLTIKPRFEEFLKKVGHVT